MLAAAVYRVADCIIGRGRTTADRMAAHRKSDQRRVDLCAGELRLKGQIGIRETAA